MRFDRLTVKAQEAFESAQKLAGTFNQQELTPEHLLHEMVADEIALDDAVGEWVEAVLRNGPQALAECKVLIRAIAGRPYGQKAIDFTVESIARVRVSPEGQEGLAAFLDKRKPNWAN